MPATEKAFTTPRRKRSKSPAVSPPPPTLPPSTEARETELIGMDTDGRMYLWDRGRVQPITAFEANGRYIHDGHYVIQWMNQAITVHLSNFADGTIRVQFKCSRGPALSMARSEIEPLLLGRVIRDPDGQARLVQLINEVRDAFVAQSQAPHRRRGSVQ